MQKPDPLNFSSMYGHLWEAASCYIETDENGELEEGQEQAAAAFKDIAACLRLSEAIAAIPDKWRWNIDKPSDENQGMTQDGLKPNGRPKMVKRKFTVYMTNGEIIYTPKFVSVMLDGDELYDLLNCARRSIEWKIEELKKIKAVDERGRR